MTTLTWPQAYDKIIQAYFKDEIKPYDECFCFCGTLSGGRHWHRSGYSNPELRNLEAALLITLHRETVGFIGEPVMVTDNYIYMEGDHLVFHEPRQKNGGVDQIVGHNDYEEGLFLGMTAALEVLKDIHRSRNENVDELPVLTKRQLV